MSETGIDAPDAIDVAAHASELKARGINVVGLYYFKSSGFKHLLTRDVSQTVSDAGLSILSVYENGYPTSAGYFTTATANMDAHTAYARAVAAGQTAGSALYFAVDYDAESSDLSAIDAYFAEVRRTLSVLSSTFIVGVYGSGRVCSHLHGKGLVSPTWLAQSTGWAGFADWKPNADVVQGPTSQVLGMDTDSDTVKPSALAWHI